MILYCGVIVIAQVMDTLGPLGRVPACTGVHFRMLLIFGSAEGKGFLKKNPVFLKDLQENERELERKRKKNSKTRHHTPAAPQCTMADIPALEHATVQEHCSSA